MPQISQTNALRRSVSLTDLPSVAARTAEHGASARPAAGDPEAAPTRRNSELGARPRRGTVPPGGAVPLPPRSVMQAGGGATPARRTLGRHRMNGGQSIGNGQPWTMASASRSPEMRRVLNAATADQRAEFGNLLDTRCAEIASSQADQKLLAEAKLSCSGSDLALTRLDSTLQGGGSLAKALKGVRSFLGLG
jgi:hypothetical protein